MKGLLGGRAWRANQTAPWLCASTSILQGHNRSATVKEASRAKNFVLQRATAEVGLTFPYDIRDPMILSFTEASHANGHGACRPVLQTERTLLLKGDRSSC